jgi:ABC-2 type transport system permease protein
MSNFEPTTDAHDADAATTVIPAATVRPPVLRTLIRREFWEHRALWIAPLAVSGLLLLLAVIGKVSFDSSLAALPEQRRALFGVFMAYAAIPHFLTLGIIISMYAGDCLYTERKDRSILFWKSMPVSDTVTVLSKLLVVMVILPLGVYLLSALTTLLMSGIYLVRAWQDHAGDVFWDAGTWFQIQWVSLVAVGAAVLWFAPITAYLLLVSAWARRNVWLWVLLPPVILFVTEYFALRTDHVWNMLMYRLGGVFTHPGMAFSRPHVLADQGQTLNMLFVNVDPLPVFSNIDTWLGVAVAALLIVATIRIRQYRDDT